MIQLTPHMFILVAVDPIDFRAGIDALVGLCRQRLEADPFGGGLFVFSNRRRTSIKILVYDGNGFWLCQKRLSSGRFAFWPGHERPGHERPGHERPDGAAPARTLEAHELQVLLMGGDPLLANAPAPWRRLRVAPVSGAAYAAFASASS